MKRLKFKTFGNEHIVYNKDEEELGVIYYYKKWKKWVWEQNIDIIMSQDCLEEVIDFMNNLKKG